MKRERLLLTLIAVLTLVLAGCLGPKVGEISGVVAYDDDTPVAGAIITVGGSSVETDDEGKFRLRSIRYGTHTVTVTLDGALLYEQKVSLSAPAISLNIEVERLYGDVFGTVRFQDGRPVGNAIVTIGDRSTQTSSDGMFALDELLYGNYPVVVSLDDGIPVHRQEIRVAETQVEADLDLPINGPNILVNPNLHGPADVIPPEGWQIYGDTKNGHIIELVDADDPERRAWKLVDVIGGGRGNDKEIGFTQTVPGAPGRYRAVFRLGLAEDGLPNQGVYVQLRFGPSKNSRNIRVTPTSTDDFDEYIVEHEAPADTDSITVYLFTQAEEEAAIRVRSISVYPIL